MTRKIFYDLETNGNWSPLNQPIEACFKIVDGKEVSLKKWLIKCPFKLSSATIDFTGITDELLLEQGIDINVAFREMADIAFEKEDTTLVGFYIRRFDNKFFNYYLMKCWNREWPPHLKMEWPSNRVYDVAAHFKADLLNIPRNPGESNEQFECRCLSIRTKEHHSLQDAIGFYNIKTDDKYHRAEADTEKAYLVYCEQIKRARKKEREAKNLVLIPK